MSRFHYAVVSAVLLVLSTGCYKHEANAPSSANFPIQTSHIRSQAGDSGKESVLRNLSIESVQSVHVAVIPAGEQQRRVPLRTDNEADRSIVSKLVEWMRSSKPGQLLAANDETKRLLRPQTQLELQLNDGKGVVIEPVCTEEIVSRKTDCHVQEGLLYVYREGDDQPSAIDSPELAGWLDKDYRYETVSVIDRGAPRAVGSGVHGQLDLTPRSAERLQNLGAPSCMGTEDDYRITGSYDIVFRKPDGSSQTIQQFKDLTIIQPDLKPIEMKKMSFDRFESFYFIPQYADCHGLEFYLYAVQDGRAFPYTFRIDGTDQPSFATSPLRDPKVIGGKLVIESGMAAGMDYPIRYTFQPDLTARTMVLMKQEDIRS